MVRFRLFLEELQIPVKCFSSSSRKHIWYFSSEGKRLFIEFYNKRKIKPYVDIRKSMFSPEYRDTYMWIINCACANLESARMRAKKRQLEEYPTAENVRNCFWSYIVSCTDCSVIPGINHLLAATSDIDYIQTIKRMPTPDLVYIGEIIYAEFTEWTQKWENIINEMRVLRRRDLPPINWRAPRHIYALMEMIREVEGKLPKEPNCTVGLSLENARHRQRERHEYDHKWLEAIMRIYVSDILPLNLEFSAPQKTSAEIYKEALGNLIVQSTDSTITK